MLSDLLDLDPELREDAQGNAMPGPRNCDVLDRQFCFVWGTQHARRNAPFTASELTSRFPNLVQTLPKHMDTCSKKQFPVVMACDPSGKKLPDELAKVMRRAKRPPADDTYDREGISTTVAVVPFMNFNELVSAGKEFGYDQQDIAGLNMDRHVDEPTD
jgi:hypothetical protein